jgi:hypothetical protein
LVIVTVLRVPTSLNKIRLRLWVLAFARTTR